MNWYTITRADDKSTFAIIQATDGAAAIANLEARMRANGTLQRAEQFGWLPFTARESDDRELHTVKVYSREGAREFVRSNKAGVVRRWKPGDNEDHKTYCVREAAGKNAAYLTITGEWAVPHQIGTPAY